MADQPLTGAPASAPQTPANAPQPTQPSPQPQPASAPAPQQAPAPADPVAPKVKLHDLPEFRQVQAKYEQQLAAERQKRTELEMRGMDDFEKLQYQNQQLQEQIQSYQAMVQEAQMMQQKQQALMDISTATGAPLEVLAEASDPDDAWRRAVQHMRTQMTQPAQPQAPAPSPQPQGNPWAQNTPTPQQMQNWQPDLGGGQANTASTRLEQELAEAQRKGDPYAYVRALRQQQAGG